MSLLQFLNLRTGCHSHAGDPAYVPTLYALQRKDDMFTSAMMLYTTERFWEECFAILGAPSSQNHTCDNSSNPPQTQSMDRRIDMVYACKCRQVAH